MFTGKEFDRALKSYSEEKEGRSNNSYTDLRKNNDFFSDVASREEVNKQIESFIDLISEMDRESFANRYVISCFMLDFCKYLERDFLFNIKNKKDFVDMKELVAGFIEKILEANRSASQSARLHTIDHLLEYYGILLDALEQPQPEGGEEEGMGFWAGNNLW